MYGDGRSIVPTARTAYDQCKRDISFRFQTMFLQDVRDFVDDEIK